MRFRKTILAAIVALAVAPAVWEAAPAQAITPSCGKDCLDLFSHQFGTFGHPGFVMDVYRQSAAVGQAVILFRTSNNDPAEDFIAAQQGTVGSFYAGGMVSSAVDLHYGCGYSLIGNKCTSAYPNDEAFEFEYAPFGAATGLCAGVASTAAAGTKVTLQPCGVSARTVWIVDTLDSPFTVSVPLINGSDTNFSHPFVLTYPSAGYPTDKPRPQLYTANITGESNGPGPVLGTVDSNQLWAARKGVL